MKRRFLSLLLIGIIVSAAFVLTACDETTDLLFGPHEHEWSQWETTKTPDCVNQGLEERSCDCGEVEQNSLPENGHTESDWIADKAPSCTGEGSRHKECTVCKEVLQSESIEKLPHNEGDWIVDKDPSCTEQGEKHTECTSCGNTMSVEEIPVKHE